MANGECYGMKMQARKRYTFLASVLVMVGGLSLACFLWVKHEQRQYAMNRALIDSLDQGDLKRALALVEAGADPNIRFTPLPPPTWRELLNQLVKHSAPSSNNSPTAFMIVCGDIFCLHIGGKGFYAIHTDDRTHDIYIMKLLELMLVHGANVNSRNEQDETALILASEWGLTDQLAVLLKHGALIDLQDYNGLTALHGAVAGKQPEAVNSLLKYHANPNVRDKSGDTPLGLALKIGRNTRDTVEPKIIRLLKAAGATE